MTRAFDPPKRTSGALSLASNYTRRHLTVLRSKVRRLITSGAVALQLLTASVFAGVVGAGALALVGPAQAAHACTYGPYWYALYAGDPTLETFGVDAYGEFDASPDAGCGVRMTVYNETKVCGFWGCNWEDWAQYGPWQPEGTSDYAYVSIDCRSGTNRYRSLAYANYLGGPNYYDDSRASGEPEYSC